MKNPGVRFRHWLLFNFFFFFSCFKYGRTYWFGLFWFKFLCCFVCCLTVSKHEPKCKPLNCWRSLPHSKCHTWCSEGCLGGFGVQGEKKRAKAKSQTTVQKGCICWSHCCKDYSVTALNILQIMHPPPPFHSIVWGFLCELFPPLFCFPLDNIHTSA